MSTSSSNAPSDSAPAIDPRAIAEGIAQTASESLAPPPTPPDGAGAEASASGIVDHPLREIMRVALPTVATMTSYTLMQFVDKFMVSKIGADPIYVGAQGNGGLVAWVPISICQGTITIVNTYVSQNFGAGKPERGAPYVWNALWVCAAFWLAVLLPLAFALPWVFRLAHLDPAQAPLASQYGSILLFGAVLSLWTRTLSQFFYGMHKPGVVLCAGVVANILNLAFNYVLVFGKLGFPALGVKGSAIGTVCATLVELAIPLAFFLGPRINAVCRTRAAWRFSRRHLSELLRLGWPGGLSFGNEMFCWGFFMVYLVGHFGDVHATAGWIAHQYMSLSFMPAVGLSVACTAIVGKCMGMGRPDLAASRAWLIMRIAMVYMGLCGVAFVAFREPLIRVFISRETSAEQAATLVRLAGPMLIAAAAFQLFDAVCMTLSGALRGAGDTVYPGVVTLICSWSIIVGGGSAIVALFPGLQSLGPWISSAAYIAVLCLVLLARFLTGKWKTIRLVGNR
jgi:MATE family multidrug resistance protein